MSDIGTIQFLTGGHAIGIRPGGRFESVVGETVVCPMAVSYLRGDGADGVAVDGRTLVFSRPGVYRFRGDDQRTEFDVIACEPECFARIPIGTAHGHGGAERDPRAILRSIVQHAEFPFTGRAAELVSRNLRPYGA